MDNTVSAAGSAKQPASRIASVDLLRAAGIILMIMGHIGFGAKFDHYIHAFHMPMFFLVSGYFFKPQPWKKLLWKRFRTLLVPYLAFGVFHIVIYCTLLHRDFFKEYLRLFLWENTAGGGMPIAGALWFLTALFFAELMYHAVQKLPVGLLAKTGIAGVISIVGMYLAVDAPLQHLPHASHLPWGLESAMVCVGLMHCGFLLKEKLPKLIELPLWLTLLLFAGFSTLSMRNGYVNMRTGVYANWLLFWINAVGMTIALWNLARFADKLLQTEKPLAVIETWLVGIGSNSIVYLCLNQLAIRLTPSFSAYPHHSRIVLALVLIELFVVQKLIFCTKLKAIFGR